MSYASRLAARDRGELDPQFFCRVKDCTDPIKTRGWCSAHYQRWERYGDPEARHDDAVVGMAQSLAQPPTPIVVTDIDKDAWFAGLADGEGHFGVGLGSQGHGYNPRFAITLRGDDAAILHQLCSCFGGQVRVSKSPSSVNPMARWRVIRKSDLLRLVSYFDQFPLRAKKARDWVIWRKAVILYCQFGVDAPGLGQLAVELKTLRPYGAPK